MTVIPAKAGFLPQEPSPIQGVVGQPRGWHVQRADTWVRPYRLGLSKGLPRGKIEPVLSLSKGWGLSPCLRAKLSVSHQGWTVTLKRMP